MKKELKILIVNFFYSPSSEAHAFRWTELAEYWAGKGLDVEVLTVGYEGKPRIEVLNKVKVTTDNELNVNYRALIKKYSKELKIDRTNKMALLTRAYAKGKINNYEGALKDINSLIKMDSNFNKEAIYFRAWFHINLKNYSEAMNDYSRLIEKNEYLCVIISDSRSSTLSSSNGILKSVLFSLIFLKWVIFFLFSK